jgi:hypothetical protein
MAIAAVDSLFLILCLGPHSGLMISLLLMALNASIECVAALEFDGDDIAL